MESKTWQILTIIGSFMFVAAALVVHQQISILAFWVSIILFGGGGVATLISLLKPPPIPPVYQTPAEQLKRRQEDLGVFAYDTDGFTYIQPSAGTHQQWTDMEALFGYNVSYYDERYATQEVHLDIFTNKHFPITIRESTPGWYQFLNRLSEHIPTVKRNWVEEAAIIASAPNMILLFDKQGRTKEQAEKECYQDKYDRN